MDRLFVACEAEGEPVASNRAMNVNARWTVLGALSAAMLLVATAARAQSSAPVQDPQKREAATAPCATAAKADAACSPTAPAKNTAQRFPFPGETPEIPLPASPQPATAKAPPAYPGDPEATSPAATTPQTKPQTRPKSGPPAYPGDPDAGKEGADGFSSSSSSSSSSPSSGDGTNSDSPLTDAGSSGDTTPKPDKTRRRKLPKVEAQTPEGRESEDLDVFEFYFKSGNLLGAYARAKDAVATMPNDPFAHFALAQAAQKMGKPEEAREHYRSVLTLDPDDKQAKATKRALSELGSSPIQPK